MVGYTFPFFYFVSQLRQHALDKVMKLGWEAGCQNSHPVHSTFTNLEQTPSHHPISGNIFSIFAYYFHSLDFVTVLRLKTGRKAADLLVWKLSIVGSKWCECPWRHVPAKPGWHTGKMAAVWTDDSLDLQQGDKGGAFISMSSSLPHLVLILLTYQCPLWDMIKQNNLDMHTSENCHFRSFISEPHGENSRIMGLQITGFNLKLDKQNCIIY